MVASPARTAGASNQTTLESGFCGSPSAAEVKASWLVGRSVVLDLTTSSMSFAWLQEGPKSSV